MIRVLFILVALLLCGGARADMLLLGAGAAHSSGPPPTSPFTPIAHATTPGGLTGGTTPAINTTGANIIFLHAAWAIGSGLKTVSDSKGNTWVSALLQTSTGPADEILYCSQPCTVGSGHTFTIAPVTNPIYGNLQVLAMSGASTVTLVDSWAGSNGTQVNAATVTPSVVSPYESYELVLTGMATYDGTGPYTQNDSDFTITDQVAAVGSVTVGAGFAYQIQQTLAQTKNPTWNSTFGAATPMTATLAVFRSSAAVPSVSYSSGPCDTITGGCGEAWSVTRAMTSSYSGPLFSLWNGSSLLDIGQTGHVADMTTWSAHCSGVVSNCKYAKIYSQIHTTSNDLIPSVFAATPDCSGGGAYKCAAAFAIDSATGLPTIRAVAPAMYTLSGDGAMTGVNIGGTDRTLFMVSRPIRATQYCCGIFNQAHAWNAPDINGLDFGIAVGYGQFGGGLTCATTTSYCVGIDNFPGVNGEIASYLIANAYLATFQYNSGTNKMNFYINTTQVVTNATAADTVNTASSFHFAAGGDLTQPAPTDWQEGAIVNSNISSGDRSGLLTNVKAFYKAMTFP